MGVHVYYIQIVPEKIIQFSGFFFLFIAEKVNKALEQHSGGQKQCSSGKDIQHCDSLDQPQ